MLKSLGRVKLKYIGLLFFVFSLIVVIFFQKYTAKLIFFSFILLIDLYLLMVYINKYKQNKVLKNILLLFFVVLPYVILFLYSPVGIYNEAQFNSPVFTKNILRLALIIYVSKFFPLLAALFSDVMRLIKFVARSFNKEKKEEVLPANKRVITRSRFIKTLGLSAGGLMFGSLVLGQFKWTSDFKTHTHYIPIERLPNAFEGFRIVQISDLHLGSWISTKPMQEMVQIINSLEPDVVVFTGDLVNMRTKEALRFEDILSQVSANFGVYAIMGNHDYGGYAQWENASAKQKNLTDLFAFYKRIGWKLLLNEHVVFEKNAEKIALVGVENWGAVRRFPRIGDIQKAVGELEDSKVKILLSHDPTHFESLVSTQHPEIDLTLSGHTHGFQFGIETPNFRWSPAQYLYKYWAGLYNENHQYLYVNRGTGFSGLPGRIGIFPEITEIILTRP